MFSAAVHIALGPYALLVCVSLLGAATPDNWSIEATFWGYSTFHNRTRHVRVHAIICYLGQVHVSESAVFVNFFIVTASVSRQGNR